MTVGALVRFLLVTGWAVFFFLHIVKHAAPGLGLSERNASATTLASNLGRTYMYTLQRMSGTKLQRIGECSTSYLRVENGFELETALHLDDLSLLAPGLTVLPFLKNASSRQLHLRFTEVLNNERKLAALRGSGNLLGLEAEGEGTVDESGLSGTYTLNEQDSVGVPTPFKLPKITPDIANGNDLAATLPPGLKPGDRFTSQLISPDITSFSLNTVTAIYTVMPQEMLSTAAGQLAVLRVHMEVDNRQVATLWCDDNGTVYLSRQRDGMELKLASIRQIGGDILWPPSLANKP